jgi:hypothetical protein
MSARDNVKLVREFWRRFLTDDIDGMLDMNSNNIVWEIGSGPAVKVVPYFGVFRGRRGCLDCLAKYSKAADPKVFEMEEYYGDKDKVFVLGHEKVVAKPTGKKFESNLIFMFTVRNGKITKMRGTFDTAALARAFTR